MTIARVPAWKTDDGRIFTNERDAAVHEARGSLDAWAQEHFHRIAQPFLSMDDTNLIIDQLITDVDLVVPLLNRIATSKEGVAK